MSFLKPRLTDSGNKKKEKMLMKNENVQLWKSDQRDELISSMVKNFPKSKENVSFDVAQKYIEKPITFQKKLRKIFFPGGNGLVKKVVGAYPELLLEFHDGWVGFYKNLGIIIDLNNFPLPKNLILEPEQNYWSVVIPDKMNPQKAFELRKQLTSVYEYTSVSKIIDVYPRIKVFIIRAEPNAKVLHPNISLNKSMELGLLGTTFTEGCLIDGRVFLDSGIHLDVSGWTLHTGSRDLGGNVPNSHWHADEFAVDLGGPDDALPRLSLRQKQF